MIEKTISAETARRFYDWLGVRHDLGARAERAAKQKVLALLDCRPGQWVLNVGVGTGKEQMQLHAVVTAAGRVYGIDLSTTMLRITSERNPASLLSLADVAAQPFPADTFDGLLCTYVLDLLPLHLIPAVLAECRRVLKPGGRIALVSLTEGVDLASKAVVGLWKTAYRLHPLSCGGCRPLQLGEMVAAAGFSAGHQEVVVQLGVPSEIIIAQA